MDSDCVFSLRLPQLPGRSLRSARELADLMLKGADDEVSLRILGIEVRLAGGSSLPSGSGESRTLLGAIGTNACPW